MFRSSDNRLIFAGSLSGDVLPICAALHNLVHRLGHKHIALDFSAITSIDVKLMCALSMIARSYRREEVDFEIISPKSAYHRRLMLNANWLHIISPERYDHLFSASRSHFSAFQFQDAAGQDFAVNSCINVMLQRIENLRRTNLKALEWSLTELTDNVLNHSESPVGGVVQAISRPNQQKVDFYVCDTGIGIAKSLRQGRIDIDDDARALKAAIEEGVTKNKETNQGNGLYGTYKCCEVSGGEFEILSSNYRLRVSKDGLRVNKNSIPFKGTLIHASINYRFEGLLERALIFKGRMHNPEFDHIERTYHLDGPIMEILVITEFPSFGSREAGRLARVKVDNLMDDGANALLFDFYGVSIISSSFADEVFGKMAAKLGDLQYRNLCRFRRIDSTVKAIIDRAVIQRSRARSQPIDSETTKA